MDCGRYMNITELTRDIKIKRVEYKGDDIRKSIVYEASFRIQA